MLFKNTKHILLVEDDYIDIMTVKRAFKELKASVQLKIVYDGEQALQYLRDESNRRPSLILLDLNMPRLNGLEFLKIVKNDDTLRKIPVIVLTTSKDERDLDESFNFSVAGYIVKPIEFNQFLDSMMAFMKYWSINQLPDSVV